MKDLKALFFISVVGMLVYFAYYQTNIGLQNVALTLLWIFTLLLFIAIIVPNNKEKKQDKKDEILKVSKYIGRFAWIAIIFAILYAGAIFMGVVLIISTLLIKTVQVTVDVEKQIEWKTNHNKSRPNKHGKSF